VALLDPLYQRIRHRDAMRAAEAPVVAGPLPDDEYTLLVTFRRDGRAVPTPVWGARDGERIVFATEERSPKVRRLRNRPDVRVAPCDSRGRPSGPPLAAVARVLDSADEDAAERVLDAKYGRKRRVYERIVPSGPLVYVEVRRAAEP
jgi:uncharacterized protein